jgi:hypothetical protein
MAPHALGAIGTRRILRRDNAFWFDYGEQPG